MKIYAIILAGTCTFSAHSNTLYNAIKPIPFDEHGWFNPSNRAMLEKFITNLKPKVVVEVGAWLGLSTRFIAKKLPKGSLIYAIDTWEGALDELGQQNDARVKQRKLFHIFLSNVIHEKLQEKIIPVRMTSLEAAAALHIRPQLVYIDGSHAEQDVYDDIITWHRKLDRNGIICGDDWEVWPSVTSAVKKAATALNYTINSSGPFWWYAT